MKEEMKKMEKINSFIDKKNPEAKAILKVFVCDPIKEDIEKVVEDMWILYNEFLMGGDKRREIQEYLGKILSLVPTIDVDDESIAEVTPVKRPIEKSSNDCYRLQLCPFGKETDKLDHDCEDLCENCKFCPITCGHCPDGLYLMTCGDSGEYDSGCSYFEPNRSYQDKLLFEDISIALNFSHRPPSPPVGIIEDIIAMINDRGPVRCMTTEEKCMEEIYENGIFPVRPEEFKCKTPEGHCELYHSVWKSKGPIQFCSHPLNPSWRCINPPKKPTTELKKIKNEENGAEMK
jgi:hypothetical protein